MYAGMVETRSLKMLLKNFHENYSDLFKKITQCSFWLRVDQRRLELAIGMHLYAVTHSEGCGWKKRYEQYLTAMDQVRFPGSQVVIALSDQLSRK